MEYSDLYTELETIGNGNYGTIYTGTVLLVKENSTNEKYAAKKISTEILNEAELLRSKQEADLLKKLQHPNIVSYKQSFTEKGKIIIVMEYCEGGDLGKLIKRSLETQHYFPETQVKAWFLQLAKALEFVHSLNILHRDIKSSNIFLTANGSLKLGDFGISKILKNSCDVAHTLLGTPLYMSPEVCLNKPYATKSDIWALGCVFYEICKLHQPFISPSLLSLIAKITKDPPEPLSNVYSENLSDLVFSMLIKDSDGRISIKEILSHEFFAENSQKDLHSDRESILNPLELYNQDVVFPSVNIFTTEDCDSFGSGVMLSASSSMDDTFIPQNERSDDEEIVIRTSSASKKFENKKDLVVDLKKKQALKKFSEPEFLEIYQYLKHHRLINSPEDVVRIMQIYYELIERFRDHELIDFIGIDQIIYYENKL